MIAVLLIIAITATVVISRVTDNNAVQVGKIEVIKSHIRYAQFRAMASNVTWGIEFNGNSYRLFKNINKDSSIDDDEIIYLPGEDLKYVNLPAGLSAREVVSFDSWGKPYSDVSGSTEHAGGIIENLTVEITAETGFIP